MLASPAAAAGSQAPGPVQVIAGPDSDPTSLGGVSIARDGTGAIAYLADVGGVQHVFVSRLAGGVFQPPVRVDPGLTGASSQPVEAAGNGGVVLVAFINSGNLYVAETPGSGDAWKRPIELHADADNPSIQMSNFGKAYLAYTASAAGGTDVDADYFYAGTWSAVTAPLNVSPGDDAGTGAGRPVVATAGDGVAIVAWGENGHVYSRRVWGTSPSVEDELLDPPSFDGETEVSAGDPSISVGGDSSYPDIAFDEQLSSDGHTQTRVLMTRLIAEDVEPAAAVDGIGTGSSDSAGSPGIAMGEYGTGFVLASNDTDDSLIATPLGSNGVLGAAGVANATASVSPIVGVPAITGARSSMIAWEQTPFPSQSEVVARFANGGSTLGAPIQLSATGAPLQTGDGVAAAGDNALDAAVAWIQGDPGALSLALVQLYAAPGTANPSRKLAYSRSSHPMLRWSAASDRWGPVSYEITLDRHMVASTTATSLRLPGSLIDGPHTWHVTATNPGGLHSTGSSATVFVDTVPPRVRLHLSGRRLPRQVLTLHIEAADRPAPQHGAKASGLAWVRISWGDGSRTSKQPNIRRAEHVYTRRGSYRITVRAADKAGNVTTVMLRVRIRK